MNWINSWKSNKKKGFIGLNYVLEKLTVIEIEVNPPLKRCKMPKNTKKPVLA